ncbi:MAG: hypothetical protein ACU0CO_10670 [Shimia sp.]
MHALTDGARGLGHLIDLNRDRMLVIGALVIALASAAILGSSMATISHGLV